MGRSKVPGGKRYNLVLSDATVRVLDRVSKKRGDSSYANAIWELTQFAERFLDGECRVATKSADGTFQALPEEFTWL
jgi:hypothetical protein